MSLSSTHNLQFCKKTLDQLYKLPCGLPFRVPVDPVALGIPDYFDFVKHPMDLGTMRRKLSSNQYQTVDDFTADFNLMIQNCRLYNNPTDPVVMSANELEAIFNRKLEKFKSQPAAPPQTIRITTSVGSSSNNNNSNNINNDNQPPVSQPRTMRDDEYKRCRSAIKELTHKRHDLYNWPFLQPVQPELWGATNYFDIIKTPMDFTTIRKKLGKREYTSPDEFEDDVRLVFNNCYTYNPPGHEVHTMGRTLEGVFDSIWKGSSSSSMDETSAHVSSETASSVPQKRPSESLVDNNVSSSSSSSKVMRVESAGGSGTTVRLKLNAKPPTVAEENVTKVPKLAAPVTASNSTHINSNLLNGHALSSSTPPPAPQKQKRSSAAPPKPGQTRKSTPPASSRPAPPAKAPAEPEPTVYTLDELLNTMTRQSAAEARQQREMQDRQKQLEEEERARKKHEMARKQQRWRHVKEMDRYLRICGMASFLAHFR
ncbi:Bromodomain-containing protein [Syncephalastrum racemosum]|uniref:Bromodomain-containing protein n=1 Tax=Syncephalastrum racemosum TaxID=13706 RepID=A0A1X2HPS6_SYNRA|nr:Bromodomain-containing protein [Syncephalastrum racemosum]